MPTISEQVAQQVTTTFNVITKILFLKDGGFLISLLITLCITLASWQIIITDMPLWVASLLLIINLSLLLIMTGPIPNT